MWHGPPGPEVRYWNERCSATFASGDSVAAVKNNADPRVVEIPIGVDTERFRRMPGDAIRIMYNIPSNAVVFLFVGRLIHIKNLPLLICTFALALKQNPRFVSRIGR